MFVLISPKNRTVYNFRGELVESIIQQGYKVYVTGPNKIDVDKIEALGAEFVEIPNDKNGVSIIADLRYLFRLFVFIRGVRATATLGYTIKPVIYGAIAAHLAGVSSVSSMITGVGYLFISKSRMAKVLKKIATTLYRIGLGASHNVIFQNPDDRAEFIAHKLVKENKTYLVNGSGVNMAKFPLSPLPSTLTFFMLARIMYSKGVIEYLEAADIIKQHYPQVKFMLLGAFENIQDSVPRPIVQDYIDRGIIDYFEESHDIVSYYAQCSVYVLPSYREGTPRTVLEAMAMGRAIITTDVPGCRETVVNSDNGFIVPARNSNELAAAMELFVKTPSYIEEMGLASHKQCEKKYSIDIVNKDMISIILGFKCGL